MLRWRFRIFILVALTASVVLCCSKYPCPRIVGFTLDGYPLYDVEEALSFVVVSEAQEAVDEFYSNPAYAAYRFDQYYLIQEFQHLYEFVGTRIHFTFDPPFGWWRTPGETWRDKTGDCEDYAIFVAAFLRCAGCPFAISIRRGRYVGPPNPNIEYGAQHAWLSVRFFPDEYGNIRGVDFSSDGPMAVYAPDYNDGPVGVEDIYSLRQEIPVP